MDFEQEIKVDQRTEQWKLFKKTAEEILGNLYDGAEISEVIGCFKSEDFKEWSDRITELSEMINNNKDKLSSEEIVVMKAKFIGEMRMYSYLNEDRIAAKKWRETEKE